MFKALKFRVQNYKNIEDSGWIPLERVTAFVGRNESGKTALLKALHKFNPATPEPYDPQREFPRDRLTHDYRNGADWPVCSVTWQVTDESLINEMETILNGFCPVPTEVTSTRYYDYHLEHEFNVDLENTNVSPSTVVESLSQLSGCAGKLWHQNAEDEIPIREIRTGLLNWVDNNLDNLRAQSDLRSPDGVALVQKIRTEINEHINQHTMDIIEPFKSTIEQVLTEITKEPYDKRISAVLEKHFPVFIYFDDYGILDSAIFLPHFLKELDLNPKDQRNRTMNAMFRHVGITGKEIYDLGKQLTDQLIQDGHEPDVESIKKDQANKEARAIKLNSASRDISQRFNEWYGQRRHSIEYQADGDYFRIWVSDDKRPNVKIELEGRSKGFQWFFSFYLVFLVESDEGHKHAILLLDEPGLHLHPTAQQELILFFEKLSEKNQLIYSTHSPFLIDGEHLHRVRPVMEDEKGQSCINIEGWPADRDTIFPLQAAAGYAMVQGLFQHKKNLLVEGLADYYYLHALSQQCVDTGREHLPDDIYIIPCGGAQQVGRLASLFLGQEVRPIILLDGDEAGRARRNALIKNLYAGHNSDIVILNESIGLEVEEAEIEDIFGPEILLPEVNKLIGNTLALEVDGEMGVIDRIMEATKKQSITPPDGWKATIALRLVSDWSTNKIVLPDSVLDKAALLFAELNSRFE